MTDNIVSFTPGLLKKRAKEFVTLYETKGKDHAANWALEYIPEKYYKEAHLLITEEFKNRGYEVGES